MGKKGKEKTDMTLHRLKSNRYTFLRYMVVLLFFLALYWAFALTFRDDLSRWYPVIRLPFYALSFLEMYRAPRNDHLEKVRFTEIVLIVVAVLNLGEIITIFIDKDILFPFLTSKIAALVISTLGFVLKGMAIGKINKIKVNEDKGYKLIEKYIETQKVKGVKYV